MWQQVFDAWIKYLINKFIKGTSPNCNIENCTRNRTENKIKIVDVEIVLQKKFLKQITKKCFSKTGATIWYYEKTCPKYVKFWNF